ncbi:IS110 family transposase [Acidiferrimicrobium sp. IK]|jgi:transposase|uniref:IS110 family transposase n=1 Tax=Acidiferrimicrobium sp. IK TaxID=2871700 RepID=UPI0021CB210F|nr:IS110 family transposase [Acidiferrimicrobium sp. IK]MCU4185750.1 IS110 family transposase [Acidiferrimicrobium sp. IK]
MTNIAQIGPTRVVIGVDTHKDLHVAVALDGLGRRIDSTTIPTTTAGYAKLVAWAETAGPVEAFGVEGTGSYGAGLARHLRAADHHVIEVVRPNRQTRRRNGKSDPADAEAAARAVISGEATGTPKSGDDLVEMIRVLRVARATAMKARTQALNALKSLVVTAPVELRDQLRGLSTAALVATAARLRSGREATTTAANKTALRALAGRYQALDTEISTLDGQLAELTAEAAPKLVETFGVGPDTAGALLVAAGDNPDRLRSEAAFAMLCGAAPVEASSGKTVRHRLNRCWPTGWVTMAATGLVRL